MSLLSEAEKREIRDAMKDVTDTFMVTPILYHSSKGSLDRWSEDKKDETFDTYLLSALAEADKGNEADAVNRTMAGSTDWGDVTLTFNLEDLQAIGLIDAHIRSTFVAEKDYFTWKNVVYNVLDVSYDGPLDAQEILIVVTGKITTIKVDVATVIITDSDGAIATRTLADILSELLVPHEHLKFADLPALPDN